MTIYLLKDNDDLVSHCECERAYITFPPQLDCPWCGCGWLFTCIDCRKAFTFARAVNVEESLNELAIRDLEGRWHKPPSDEDIEQWVAAMEQLLANVEVQEQYVCFDGLFLPTSLGAVRFQGWHASHDLEFVPQVAALDDYFVREDILTNVDYWQSNAIPRDEYA